MHMCGFFLQGIRHYRPMGGMPNDQEPDHPMSVENPTVPVYATIEDAQKESESQPSSNGNLNINHKSPEPRDQLPSHPLKRTVSYQFHPRPLILETRRRPSAPGAIETPPMENIQLSDQQHPRKAPIGGARVNNHQQRQEKPLQYPRARAPSEHGDPFTPIPEENTSQARVYERDMPQTTNPVTISEQGERQYVNVQQTAAKISVESHDE